MSERAAPRLLAAGLALVVCAPVVVHAKRLCPGARTTVEMNACVTAEIQAADRALNRYLAEARRVVTDRPTVLAALDRSQTAWLAFRDAECAAVYELYVEGSARGAIGGGCRLGFTRRRTHQLWRTYLQQQSHTTLPEPANS
jgi:uncharacterized protein YecT (DUF1311 family)